MRIFLALLLALLWHTAPAFAIATNVANTLSSCGTAGYAPNHDAPLTVNLLGELCINGSGGGGGGTSSNFGDPFPVLGTAAGFKDPSNNMAPGTLDADGGLNVHVLNGASGGTSSTDESAFTAGSTSLTPSGGFYQTTATSNPLTNGQQGMVQMTAQRALFTNLRNASGTEIATSSNPLRVDPTGSTTQPVSAASLPLPSNAAIETGGNLATIAGTVTSNRVAVNPISGQTGVAGGSGTVSATTQRVTLATDVALPTGTNTIGSVGVIASTSGGASGSHAVLANTTNATVVKASAGQVYTIDAFNNSSTLVYVKLYDKATTPTCNTDTVVWSYGVPANGTAGGGFMKAFPVGRVFSSGIAYCVTGALADNDNTSLSNGANVVLNVGYK